MSTSSTKRYVGSLDQGTTSSRFFVFDEAMELVAGHQVEHRQLTPHPGWLEHDAEEIYNNCVSCINGALVTLRQKNPSAVLSCIGVANQRETTVAWSRSTGVPCCPALVWSDMRTQRLSDELAKRHGGPDFARARCGLPCSTYFSAVKMAWMLAEVPAVAAAAARGDLCFGTIDTWLIWKLTKGHHFVTDVTNASRTMLMDLGRRAWSEELAALFGVSLTTLPRIVSNSGVVGPVEDAACTARGVPITGCIGDQHGALLGQLCLTPGSAKNTYGTGCFMLMNIGTAPVQSTHGLLTTVAFQLGAAAPAMYALEGSVAGAGSTIQWLQRQLGILENVKMSGTVAALVPDSGGVVFVPAFSGLFAPYWRPDARGTIVGMTLQTNKNHIVRAALEAVAHQCARVLEAMRADSGVTIRALSVDGGMAANGVLVQVQADLLQLPVHIPRILETTALGAAICAGLAGGVWASIEAVQEAHQAWRAGGRIVRPVATPEVAAAMTRMWNQAVERSLDWQSHL